MASTTTSPVHTTHTIAPDPGTLPSTNLVNIHFGLLIATHVGALLLTTACVGLRLYVRRVIVKDVALDDWVLVAAQVSYVIYITFMFGFAINIEIYGLEKVFWQSLRIASLWEVPLVLTMILVRAAIAAFFVRILPAVDNRTTRTLITSIFCFYAIFMITYMFLNVFQCGDPLKKRYNYIPYCISGPIENNLPIVARIVTMVLDWVVTFLPILVIIRSTLSRKAKLSVIGLMLLAGAGSTLSVLSIVFNNLGLWFGPKSFGDFTVYSIFSLLENGVAIIVLSLAALRPLFQKYSEGDSQPRARSSASQCVWFTPGSMQNRATPAPANDDLIFLTQFKTEHEYTLPMRPNASRQGVAKYT